MIVDVAAEDWLLAAYTKLELFRNAMRNRLFYWTGGLWRLLVPAIERRVDGTRRFASIDCRNMLYARICSFFAIGTESHVDEGLLWLSAPVSWSKALLWIARRLCMRGVMLDNVSTSLAKAIRQSIVLLDGAYVLQNKACINTMNRVGTYDWLSSSHLSQYSSVTFSFNLLLVDPIKGSQTGIDFASNAFLSSPNN